MQINKRIFLFFILLATGLAMTVAQAEPLSKGMGIVKRLSAEHGNDAKVSVQMRLAHTSSSRRSFQLGNKIHIEVSSPQSGFLYLLDINSKGQLTVIFPNRFSKQNKHLKAKQPIIIPDENYGFDFVIQEPMGNSLLVALLVAEDFMANVLPKEFEQIETAEADKTLKKLRALLNDMLQQDDTDELPVSVITLDYEVVAKNKTAKR